MSIRSVAWAALALPLCLAAIGSAARAEESATEAVAPPTPQVVRELANWAVASGDNGGLPFAIIDKTTASVFVFGPYGTLLGAEAALLGEAIGDESVPGIGDRPLSKIRPHERTTPAGRFVGGFGPALGQEETLWVDYGTAISLHPVVTGNPKERRARRLKSRTPEDNRITYGCINVSAAFYETVIRNAFDMTKGVFYILPDTKPLEEVFPAFVSQAHARAGGVKAAAY